jgi:hypothetical protein
MKFQRDQVPTIHNLVMNSNEVIAKLIPNLSKSLGNDLVVTTPVDGSELASLAFDTAQSIEIKISQSVQAFRTWRDVPGPKRGELIRQFGNKLREHKEDLSTLVSLECGKILEEGRGEVHGTDNPSPDRVELILGLALTSSPDSPLTPNPNQPNPNRPITRVSGT